MSYTIVEDNGAYEIRASIRTAIELEAFIAGLNSCQFNPRGASPIDRVLRPSLADLHMRDHMANLGRNKEKPND